MLRATAVILALASVTCSTYKHSHESHAVRHSPRTLWDVCWSDNGKMLLPSDDWPHAPKCAKPRPIVWPGARVRIATHTEHPHLDAHLDAAIAQWNAWLGWDMLTRTGLGYDVVVLWLPPSPFLMGLAHLEIEAGVMVGGIAVYGYYPSRAYHTLLHEIGHILGLAHDVDGSGGLMGPGSADDELMVKREDIEAIRRLYGR